MPGIVELLTCVGNDSIEFQKLADCLTGAKEKKREECTELSFVTQAITPTDIVMGSGKIGLVIWVEQPTMERAYFDANKPKPETAVLLETLLKEKRQLRNIIDVMQNAGEYHEGINTSCWVQQQLKAIDKN